MVRLYVCRALLLQLSLAEEYQHEIFSIIFKTKFSADQSFSENMNVVHFMDGETK